MVLLFLFLFFPFLLGILLPGTASLPVEGLGEWLRLETLEWPGIFTGSRAKPRVPASGRSLKWERSYVCAGSCAALCNPGEARVERCQPGESHWCLPGVCLKLPWTVFWAVKSNGHGRFFLPLRFCPQFPFFTFSTLNGIDVPICFVVPNHSELNLSPWCCPCTFGLVSSVNFVNLLQLKEEGVEGQENVITQTGIQPGHRVNYLWSCK